MDTLQIFGLKDKNVIVAGGARGIGLAVAELSCAVGANVAIIDVLEEEGAASAKRLQDQTGRKVTFQHTDLTDPALAAATVEAISTSFGKIDVLMNCIGIGPNTPFLEITPKEWTAVMNVNVNAQFYLAQAVAAKMAASGGGSIVSIGSNSGLIVDRPQAQAHYNASKAAVHQMVRSMACELASHKIRVDAVAPGFIMTPMTQDAIAGSDWLPVWEANTPMGRMGEPHEVAQAMLYLASEAASYTTGSILVVDGSYTC